METKNHEQLVKERYANVAKTRASELSKLSGCCGGKNIYNEISQQLGYSGEQINSVPEDANLGAGCGNPLSLSPIKKGDTVLDLGSGAGFDCFIASGLVGESGKIIGIDFTPEMIKKAEMNAEKGNYKNVKFLLANIESIPLVSNSVDLIISNCVINLSENKQDVFKESFRILKEGGHLSVSDIVLEKVLPERVFEMLKKHINCFSGAVKKSDFLQMLKNAGFKNIKITKESHYPIELILSDPIIQAIVSELNPSNEEKREILSSIVSASFYAEK
jgi:SAM-dependent methyltransferase